MKQSLISGLLAAASVIALACAAVPTLNAQQPITNQSGLVAKGGWNASTTYAKDDIVTARGSTWRSKVAGNKNHVPGSTNPNTAAFWEAFAVGFNPAGAWVTGNTYQPNELVTYHGQTWRAKLTNTSSAPAANANWELWVVKGATGPAGPNTGVGAGTQTAPSISFSGDPNTGIFHPGADKIALVENGVLFLHNKGSDNAALGLEALRSVDTGTGNTAVGRSALMQLTNGSRNSAFGADALYAATSTFDNSAFGTSALFSTTTGDNNIAVGSYALTGNTSGASNTAVGSNTLSSNQTGDDNVAVGFQTLGSATGNKNTAVGSNALGSTTSGERNTVLGYSALSESPTGNDNIAIGHQAGIAAPTNVSNSIYIGNDGTSTGSNTTIIGNGSTTSVFMGGISGVTSIGGAAVYINSSGQFGTATSSRRFKQDIEPVTGSMLLDRLQPVSFRYKQADTDGSMPLQYGLIAEDVEAISRDLVIYDKDGKIQTVKYHFLPPLLLAGYQAQQKTITALNARDRQQAEKITALEERLAKLEATLSHARAASLRQ